MSIDFDPWGLDDDEDNIWKYLAFYGFRDDELYQDGDLYWYMSGVLGCIDKEELKALTAARRRSLEKGMTIARSNSLDLYENEQTFDWSRLPPSAYHWIPLVNLKSILKSENGLLSRTFLDLVNVDLKDADYLDVSNKELSSLRSRTSLPDGTLIADYVPFYFCDQPPMAYLAIKSGTTQKSIPPMEWAVIEISLKDLVKHQWWATNRHFHNTVRGLPWAANSLSELAEFKWSSILTIGNFGDKEVLDYRQAELLIHMRCSVTKWKNIIVSSFETESDLREIDPLLSHKGVSVNVDSEFFHLDRRPRNSLPGF